MSCYYKFEKSESGVTCRVPSGADLVLYSPETSINGITPEWGVISNGSHCLSFSILRHALGETNTVYQLYEPFCVEVLGKLKLIGWQIDKAQVNEFTDWKFKSRMWAQAVCSSTIESPESSCLETYQEVPNFERPGWLNDVNVSLSVSV
jgi:hypothetical protein